MTTIKDQSYEIEHFPVTTEVSDRINRTGNIICDLKVNSVLDIGGADFFQLCKNKNIHYKSLNIEEPQKTGTGGYHKAPYTITYDGKIIPFASNTFELVIVNFVLHHTPDNALDLLRQIHSISSKYILIGEDIAGLDYELQWHKRNYEHQPGGIFRSDQEWKILFDLYKMRLIKQCIIHRTTDGDQNKIYRALYILEKK